VPLQLQSARVTNQIFRQSKLFTLDTDVSAARELAIQLSGAISGAENFEVVFIDTTSNPHGAVRFESRLDGAPLDEVSGARLSQVVSCSSLISTAGSFVRSICANEGARFRLNQVDFLLEIKQIRRKL